MTKIVISIILFFSLISCSFWKYPQIFPEKKTAQAPEIFSEPLSRVNKNVKSSFGYLRSESFQFDDKLKNFDLQALQNLYLLAKAGIDRFGEDLGRFHDEIFARNRLNEFSPAEWAIWNNNLVALEKFLLAVKDVQSLEAASFYGTNLLTMVLQRNNFDAVKIICECTTFVLFGRGFLSIAVQHHVSDDILDFLLDYCGLAMEIDQRSIGWLYKRPLETCVKFNNFKAAVLLLNRGADISARDYNESPNEFALATILAENKERMLRHILTEVPSLCEYRDTAGNSLLHQAVIYARDPKIIYTIMKGCPNLSVDAENTLKVTPLALALKFIQDGPDSMASILIKAGANIYHQALNAKLCPLERIVRFKIESVFMCLLKESNNWTFEARKLFLTQSTQFISTHGNWKFLDHILAAHPKIPLTWIEFKGMTFSVLLANKCFLTFRFLLANQLIKIPASALEQIRASGSLEFLAIAKEFGYAIDNTADPAVSMRTVTELCFLENGSVETRNLLEFESSSKTVENK